MRSSRTFRGAVAIVALTTAALLGTAGSALACHSDDNRPHPTPGKATPCAEGTDLSQSDVKAEIVKNRLIIHEVNAGVTVKRIVVIGGDDGFNDYTPGARGLEKAAPWKDLRAPFSRNGRQADIEKWYLCGTKTAPTETSKPTKPTETSKPTESTSAPSSSETVKPTSTTAPAVVPAGNESGTGGGLANTGFDNMWLVWIAVLLLLGGGGLLALLKFRRKASE
jgi:LPXTG-motif cell wall-anchored protein